MDFSEISYMDKLILINALGFKSIPDNVSEILTKAIKDYSINLYTGKVSITYVQPVEMLTVTIDVGGR